MKPPSDIRKNELPNSRGKNPTDLALEVRMTTKTSLWMPAAFTCCVVRALSPTAGSAPPCKEWCVQSRCQETAQNLYNFLHN